MAKFLSRAQRTKAQASEVGEDRKDPILAFGFGIVAYLDLIYTFFWLFMVLSFLLTPVMQFYKGHTGYKTPIGYENMSLGNMGFSTAQCVNVPMDVSSTPLHCPYGTIGHIKDFGVTPA